MRYKVSCLLFIFNAKIKLFVYSIYDLRLFSSDAFFLRTFTYICSIHVNERVYVFWALRTYTLGRLKNAALEINPKLGNYC